MKIFIVDEDWEVEVLRNALAARHPGDEFILADTLKRAVELLWSTRFDLLVIDIMIPADDSVVPRSSELAGLISGILLYERVKNDPQCANHRTPVLFFTGLIANEHPKVKEAKASFGDRFLHKPVHPDVFYKLIKEAVSSR